jgi:hypothetical protein
MQRLEEAVENQEDFISHNEDARAELHDDVQDQPPPYEGDVVAVSMPKPVKYSALRKGEKNYILKRTAGGAALGTVTGGSSSLTIGLALKATAVVTAPITSVVAISAGVGGTVGGTLGGVIGYQLSKTAVEIERHHTQEIRNSEARLRSEMAKNQAILLAAIAAISSANRQPDFQDNTGRRSVAEREPEAEEQKEGLRR